jgi:predicted Zn-dependent protease
MAPWIAIVIATIALAVSLVSWVDRSKSEGTARSTPSPVSPALSSSVPLPGQAVDLSSMSPREAADRLFNRVMAAVENGNTAEVSQFTPMALQAYENLGTLDNDSRYHVALIRMAANDIKGTREQIDLLRKTTPKHLFGYVLEHQIAERNGNRESASQTYKAFLDAYEAEIAAGREEYQEHMKSIEGFQKAAQASVAGKKQ